MKFPSIVPSDHVLILRAAAMAVASHGMQTRKFKRHPDDPDVPYMVHPLRVAAMVAQRTMDPHVIAAATMHDVVEDTETTVEQIHAALGERVALMVDELTDHFPAEKCKPPEWNRAKRKAWEHERLGMISANSQLIKAYDMIDNAHNIVLNNPNFARVYVPELAFLMTKLTKIDSHVAMDLQSTLAWAERELVQQALRP